MNIKRTIITTIVALAMVATVAPGVQAVTIEELLAQITQLQAQLVALQGNTGTPVPTGNVACAGVTFNRALVVGSTGQDVKCLQVLLNTNGYTLAQSGAGSPGMETSYFGPITLAAVKQFQVAKGWTPANQVGPLTRAALNALITSTPVTPGTPTQPVGSVSAALAYDNPAGTPLVVGQGLTTLAKVQLTGTGTVTGVTLKRIGVSADSTLNNVYLFDGNTRITDSASVSGGSTITFSGLNLAVSGSRVLTVKSTIAGTAGESVGVQLTGVTLSSGTVSGLPVSGNLFSLSSATLATVAVGTALPSTATTTDPENDVRVWESTLTVGNRDVTLTRLALRQINSINSADIKNFRLYVDGTQVATAELDADKYVTFVMNKTLTSGNRNVKVLADVIGGSSYYIQMSLRTAADIEVIDSQYGVTVTATGLAATTETIQVNSGAMTVEKATDSPSGNVVNAASDVVLAKYNFKANGEPVKVETLIVDFAHVTSGDSTETSTLRNGKIFVNGSQVGSTTTLDPLGDPSGYPADSGTSFSTNFIVYPGSPVVVEVRADLYDNDGDNAVSDGDKVTVTLSAGISNAERRVSYGRINVPSANVSGNQVTVSQGTVALSKQSNYADQTTVVPQTGYKLAAYNLTGNSSEDVNIHTISVDFTAVSGSDFTYLDLSNVYVKYGTQTTSTKSTISSATSNSWSVNNFTLAKNATVPVEIYATIGSSMTTTASIKATTTITGLTAQSSQTAATSATDGQTIASAGGSITGTKNTASTPVLAIVADNQEVAAADYKFTALNDSYRIAKLTFTLAASTSIQEVYLQDCGTVGQPTTCTTVATLPGADTLVFNLSNPITVEPGTSKAKVLRVAHMLGTVGTGAGTTGEAVTVTLGSDSEAIANSTGVQADMTIGTGAANALYAYAAVPTITPVALPSGTLQAGAWNTVAKFTVSSDSGTVAWKKIVLAVTKTADVTIADASAIKLYDSNNNEITCSTAASSGLSGTDTSGTFTFVVTNEEQISGGKTYYVKANVGGTATVNVDYISTSIAKGSGIGYVAPDDYAAVADTNATFVWSDMSSSSHDATSTSVLDWNNDYLVKNIPTDSQRVAR